MSSAIPGLKATPDDKKKSNTMALTSSFIFIFIYIFIYIILVIYVGVLRHNPLPLQWGNSFHRFHFEKDKSM